MAGLSSTFHPNRAAEAERVVRGALDWWRTAGVEGGIGDRPTSWLERAVRERPVRRAEAVAQRPTRQPASAPILVPGDPFAAMPRELVAFRAWAATAPLPGVSANARRTVSGWAGTAEAAVVVGMPDSCGDLLEAGQERLLTAMMAAIGRTSSDVALLPVIPASVGARLNVASATVLRPLVLRHLELIGCRHVLLLGEGPCRALLDESAPLARGRWHSLNHEGAELSAVVTLDLATLLTQPACKREAWSDLLLFAEGPSA